MENTILNEASMVELWKTKCDSLRAFEPSAFYKDILASEPTDRYFFRGIKDSDIIYQILENSLALLFLIKALKHINYLKVIMSLYMTMRKKL